MAKEALLILDMLEDFTREGSPLEVPDNRKLVPVIQKEIKRARAEGMPVIYVCDRHAPQDREFSKFGWPAHGVKGSPGAEVVAALKPEPGDVIIEKTHYSGFFGTNLKEKLDELGITGLVLTGCLTHICVLYTTYEAVEYDYDVTVLADGVADVTEGDHNCALRFMKESLGAKLEWSGVETKGV
ncbi:MAG: cysteine hydrolase [Actinomycetota bacterium]|nr:cysteine hydrolase [Actinomycetota bacterium]